MSAINLTPLKSSNLAAAGWHNNTLTLKFVRGHVYNYPDVPKEVFVGLLNAASPGTYFARHIKDKYPHEDEGL